jgi:hypothetical protein
MRTIRQQAQSEPDLDDVVRALSWSWRAAQAAGRPDLARAILTVYLLVVDLDEIRRLPEAP